MNAKKIVPLVISLISAVLVLFVAMKYMSNKTTTSLLPKRPQVVVCKTPIGAGAVITEEQLTMGDISIEPAPDTVFQNPGQLIGRVPAIPLMPGQIITQTSLTAKGSPPGMGSLVPNGMRAITLDINEITGVAGNIQPGSHVDIMQTLRNPETAESSTRVIAQNVKVAMTGMPHGPEGGDGGGRSITVWVTPAQASLLELASLNGRARMALRGANDNVLVDIPPIPLSVLLGEKIGKPNDKLAQLQPTPSTVPSATTANQTSFLENLFASAARNSSTTEQNNNFTMHVVRSGADTEVQFRIPRKPSIFDSTDVNASPELLQK